VNRTAALALGFVALATASVSSCATFNRNDVAADVGGIRLSAKEAHTLVAGEDPTTVGPHLRANMTAWIKMASVASSRGVSVADIEQQTRVQYPQGLSGSPAVCIGAILVNSMADTQSVLDSLKSGMSFADAAGLYSVNSVLAANGGLLVDADGSECVASSTVPANLADALKPAKEGQPYAADFGTFAAVLVLRSYDELSFESRADLVTTSLTELEIAQALKDAGVWVDPRYGRWSNLTESVEPLRP
jgi:hypothetical protein